MKIVGFIPESFQDWRGLTSVIFTEGCNFQCPACYAKKFLGKDREDYGSANILERISAKKKFIDKIVICGGEPTIHSDLSFFLEELKKREIKIKLDTNGSNYDCLQRLLSEGLVDYVAMDVKGPPNLYFALTGREMSDEIKKGISIVSQFPDYEFRTTIVPVVRSDNTSFMTIGEVVDTAKYIIEVTGKNNHKYFLQPFTPRRGELLDPRLEDFAGTPPRVLQEMHNVVKDYLPNCKIR